MKVKLIVQVVLAIGVLVLAYYIYVGVMAPVRFDSEKKTRRDAVIEKMKDIRTIQTMFYQLNGHYCASFDSLITFVKTGKMPLIKLTARPGDSTFTDPIRDTVGYVSIQDSLFKKRKDFNIDNLAIIPFSGSGNAKPDTFNMQVAVIKKGEVPVNVIQVFAANKFFLKGLEMEYYGEDPEDGVRFGSLTEPATDGNWE